MMMLGMQDDKKLPNDLGTAYEVILVQSETLVKLKEKNGELHKSLQEALAEIRFLRSGKKREKFINADQMLLEFPEDKELQAALEAAKKEAERSGTWGAASQGIAKNPRSIKRVSRRPCSQECTTCEQARRGIQLHTQPLGCIECICQ